MSAVEANRYRNRIDFYSRIVGQWIPDRQAAILVVGGGENDADVFDRGGYRNVTFTNLAAPDAEGARGVSTAAADAESLPYADRAYEYTVAHAVLHHCHSPHRALLELYRVASRAAIAFEARDSALMRLAERLGVGNSYELSAVEANGGKSGGVRDSAVPNYVYRWTEREVEKAIASFAPHARHQFFYAYGFGTPCTGGLGGWRRSLRSIAAMGYRGIATLLPRQRNLFAFCVMKPELPGDLQPWLIAVDGVFAFRSR